MQEAAKKWPNGRLGRCIYLPLQFNGRTIDRDPRSWTRRLHGRKRPPKLRLSSSPVFGPRGSTTGHLVQMRPPAAHSANDISSSVPSLVAFSPTPFSALRPRCWNSDICCTGLVDRCAEESEANWRTDWQMTACFSRPAGLPASVRRQSNPDCDAAIGEQASRSSQQGRRVASAELHERIGIQSEWTELLVCSTMSHLRTRLGRELPHTLFSVPGGADRW